MGFTVYLVRGLGEAHDLAVELHMVAHLDEGHLEPTGHVRRRLHAHVCARALGEEALYEGRVGPKVLEVASELDRESLLVGYRLARKGQIGLHIQGGDLLLQRCVGGRIRFLQPLGDGSPLEGTLELPEAGGGEAGRVDPGRSGLGRGFAPPKGQRVARSGRDALEGVLEGLPPEKGRVLRYPAAHPFTHLVP